MNRFFVLLILFFAIGHAAYGQSQRFKAGITGGFNAAQIRGDESAGYNRLGLTGGLVGVVIINDRVELSTEILYSQRGSSEELISGSEEVAEKIKLTYVEIPLLFHFYDWLSSDGEYYQLQFTGGFSYGRLLQAKINAASEHFPLVQTSINPDDEFFRFEESLNQNDFALVLGASFYINPQFGLNLRYNRSLNLLYDNSKEGNNVGLDSLRGFFLSFKAFYLF